MAEHERIALFLGAGASKAFNFPVTREIIPKIWEKIKGEKLFGSSKRAIAYRKQLKEFLEQLLPGITKADVQHLLITEILSLLDHLILNSTVPFPKTDVRKLTFTRMLLERAIFEVLDWPYDPKRADEVPPQLIALAKWIYKGGRRPHCALISTNYDECIETEVYRCVDNPEVVNERIDFGLNWREYTAKKIFNPLPNAKYGIYKLHGSVGWLKCELCNLITCHDGFVFNKKAFSARSYMQGRSSLSTCGACGHSPLRSVMVAPSTVRDVRDMNLLSVWRAAFEALRAADRWFIIGYSMPTEDVMIRSMLIRAYHSREVKPEIEVIQHGDDEQTRSRYEMYFPCKYDPSGMEGFVERLDKD